MFNLKKHAVAPYEKYLREENVGPKADDTQPITEKAIKDRQPDAYVTTEAQFEDRMSEGDTKIIEKVLEEATSNYVEHRAADDTLIVPPINTLVEQINKERMKEFKTTKESNWTVSFDGKKQNASLPEWTKGPAQHDKPVLNNDPERFSKDSVKPLVGDITTAHINDVVSRIKTGESYDYDSAMVSILEKAASEDRELTQVERNAISDIKIARTQAMLKK
jgi:hypothetical protein